MFVVFVVRVLFIVLQSSIKDDRFFIDCLHTAPCWVASVARPQHWLVLLLQYQHQRKSLGASHVLIKNAPTESNQVFIFK